MNKSLLSACLWALAMLMLIPSATFAGSSYISFYFEVDGIVYYYTNYNSRGNSCSVVHKGAITNDWSKKYEGDLVIPSEVTWDGKDYYVQFLEHDFSDSPGLKSVIFPSFYVGGDSDLFRNCPKLKKVACPNPARIALDSLCKATITYYDTDNMIIDNGFMWSKNRTILSYVPYELSGSYTIPSNVTKIGIGAFGNCSDLTSITIPSSVKAIGPNAFDRCTGLSSITIPESVTSIEQGTFANCSGLTSITIPNSVTTIGKEAFANCSGLTSITIPSSVTTIGEGAFANCSGLTSITIPNSVTVIDKGAFANCTALTSITLPSSVTTIGEEAFANCTSLTSIDIPNSVTSIGQKAFSNCSSFSSISLPNSITSIEQETFIGCSGLTSMTIPTSVTTIGDNAFRGCIQLKSITIPESVTSIGSTVFRSCNNLTELVIADSKTRLKMGSDSFHGGSFDKVYVGRDWTYIDSDGNSVQRNEYFPFGMTLSTLTMGSNVTTIPDWAFYKCQNLSQINFSNSLTTIGNFAFQSCPKLGLIVLPQSLTSIGNWAFGDCLGLYSVVLLSDCKLSNNVFYDCTGLKKSAYVSVDNPFKYGVACRINLEEVLEEDGFIYSTDKTKLKFAPWNLEGEYVVPNHVSTIDIGAFMGCTKLKTVKIPDTVTEIKYSAFEGCTALDSITIPNSVTKISCNMFAKCTSLRTIDLPHSILGIDDLSFNGCTRLLSVVIPPSVNYIVDSSFANCTYLAKVALPYGINIIDNTTNYSYSNYLKIYYDPNSAVFTDSVIIDSNNTRFCYAPLDLRGHYNIPSTIKSIASGAFARCTSLESVSFPSSISQISTNAFAGCTSLTSVSIPGGVSEIQARAFAGCTSLSSVAFPGSVNFIGDKAFFNCNLKKIILPPSVTKIGEDAFFNNFELEMFAFNFENWDKGYNSDIIDGMPDQMHVTGKISSSEYQSIYYSLQEQNVHFYSDDSDFIAQVRQWFPDRGSRIHLMERPQSLTIQGPDRLQGCAGEQFSLKATLLPANLDLPYVFWRSTNPSVAVADADGTVTILQDATADMECDIIAETLYTNTPVAKYSIGKASGGIDDLTEDADDISGLIDVYNMQGVKILSNVSADELSTLSNGIYVVHSGRHTKKIVVR